MKQFFLALFVALIVTRGSIWGITTFGLPRTHAPYAGSLQKDLKQNVIQERVEDYKKTSNLESDITKAIETAMPSVVSIVTTKDLSTYLSDSFGGFTNKTTAAIKQQKVKLGGGSGIIVSKDGYIITNKHVVEDATANYTVVTRDGETYAVTNTWRDPVLDIAILKIVDKTGKTPAELQPASFVSLQSPVLVGQFVVAIGNAMAEYQNTSTFGIISAKNRNIDPQHLANNAYIGLYQTDTPINPGNSGGPLVNTAGEILGLNTATADGAGISFVLPLSREFMQTTLTSLDNKTNSIQRPFLGIQSNILSPAAAKSLNITKFTGIYVSSVELNSPAARAGVLSGDVIVDINDSNIPTDMPLLYSLYTYHTGDSINLLVYRNKDYKKLSVQLVQGK